MTQLLGAAATGDQSAFGEVIALAYSDLEGLTAAAMYDMFGDWIGTLTLTPTDVLHEAIQRLMAQRTIAKSRNEFFATAAILIERTIVDYQRRRLAAMRGGKAGRGESLNEHDAEGGECLTEHIEALDNFKVAMEQIIEEDPIMAEVLVMRAFGKFSRAKVIELTELSPAVVDRAWKSGVARLDELLAG